jgi:hypothetical protein
MLDDLLETLLYEGYALYPYTPGATKNATPTPFGIVYPPAYAAECEGAFDHARLECFALPEPGARLTATLRYLTSDGERNRAQPMRFDVGPLALGERRTVGLPGGRFTLRSDAPAPDGSTRVRACVHNVNVVEAGLDRAQALAHALISTQIVVTISDGRFVSPLELAGDSVNIWPVLATPGDDTVLGAAIVLPDHPQVSPRSFGTLFDNTEIEEALMLHVHTLSDEEREQAGADPAVAAMLARALAATPADIVSLHSGLREAADG